MEETRQPNRFEKKECNKVIYNNEAGEGSKEGQARGLGPPPLIRTLCLHPHVAVITSNKDGVGKTTTTSNTGLSLACLGFSVVAIDADVSLRNLDLLLDLENLINYTMIEVLNALVRDKRWSNFELLCISKPRYKLPLGFGGKALTWLVDALKARSQGYPDFILIDCSVGIDAGFITTTMPANEAILSNVDRITDLLKCDIISCLNKPRGAR
ncbi:putative septum site-determining protein minD, chloroplastic [Glycine max]|nr:putative septum site-determining protein minD, chloroplastic [Glycine max]